MSNRTPPLSSLRLFEAAGRHLSFARAAAELNLTPSAVSHGIVGLEKALGVKLFLREPGRLSLTREGADYLPYVSEALSLILIGTRRLQAPCSRRSIRLSCVPTMASRWLLPRLGGFRSLHPGVDVTVDTSRRQVGFPGDGFDFALRMSRVPVTVPGAVRLFEEQLVPLCSPAYRDAKAGRDGRIDLARACLIHVTVLGEDWQAWFDAKGEGEVSSPEALRFDTIQLAVEAAVAGLGVVLGRRPLVDPEIRSGVLVEAGHDAIPAETAYWLVSAETVDDEPHLRAFKGWLLEEAGSALKRESA